MRALIARPIDELNYAPFGRVIRAGDPSSARSANHGRALAWDAQAELENQRPNATATVSLFRCLGTPGPRIALTVLERHPDSTQMFVPMTEGRYLAVVAGGAECPDLSTLRAFFVEGHTAITYAPGTWHHPMIALEGDIDFVNVLFVDGSARDCEEASPLEAKLFVHVDN